MNFSRTFQKLGKLTGKQNYRLSFFGKAILRVEQEILEVTVLPYEKVEPKVVGSIWRDATASDLKCTITLKLDN